VSLPGRKRPQFLRVLHVIEVCQHLPEFIRRVGWNALHAIFRIEPLQAPVREVPYSHRRPVNCSLTLVGCDGLGPGKCDTRRADARKMRGCPGRNGAGPCWRPRSNDGRRCRGSNSFPSWLASETTRSRSSRRPARLW
jgi:hypothetical protein